MSASANLALPFIEGGELLPDVTLNETLRLLDTLVQLAIIDRDLNAPPTSPAEGQRWIVKASPSPTGAWAGHGNHVAAWQDGGWVFCVPQVGWFAYMIDEGALVAWNGTAWVSALAMLSSLQNLSLLGVGTTADATNPFTAKLNNALWVAKTVAEGGDGNLRYKLSKESAAKTLSLLFQDNFSGRAEIGLTGDDDFHFKVSADGSTWYEGIRIDRASGRVSFPVNGGPRETLSANRTYYVRADGSDSNTGLANTSGGAFLTVQKAIDSVAAIDLSTYSATIQIGTGTYTGLVSLKTYVGVGPVIIVGDETTPSNVVFSSSTAGVAIVQADAVIGKYALRGVKLTSSVASQHGLYATNGSVVEFQNLDFGSLNGGWQAIATDRGALKSTGNYAISGGADRHFGAVMLGTIRTDSITVTLTGTPAFATAFAYAHRAAVINAVSVTYSGSATGPRYSANANGVINTVGGANYFPGNSAGSTGTGGQYL